MKKVFVYCSAAFVAIASIASCKALKPQYIETEIKDVQVPEKISFNGGTITIDLKLDTLTKSKLKFVPWQYRVMLDDKASELTRITEATTEVKVWIPGNYTAQDRQVKVEMIRDDQSEWSTVASFEQQAAAEHVVFEGDYDSYWAKGNIDVKDGAFIVAETPSDAGLLFMADNRYGIKAEKYNGTAYGPDVESMTLEQMATKEAFDPCKAISSNFRTPSYMDFYNLENVNYADPSFDWVGTMNGVKGIQFKNSGIFLPFSGVVARSTGVYSLKNVAAGYWMLGGNALGEHCIYTVNEAYTAAYYDIVSENLASVRCVVDRKLPEYKSHSFDLGEISDKQTNVTVMLDLGEYSSCEVIAQNEYGISVDAMADKTGEALLAIPMNIIKKPVLWKLFVNRMDTGIEFTQPAAKDYAFYVSHTPTESDYNAFTLNVEVDTDRSSVIVMVKGLESNLSTTVSASSPVAKFDIPQNSTSSERTLTIWIDGKNTGKSVKQGAAPAGGLSVEWSSGALTIKDGKYVFADPKERGMLFKHNSQYGIAVEGEYSSSSNYPGYAYCPEKTTVAYADIKSGQVDPCSLVAPAGTWRMPTMVEIGELKEADNGTQFEAGVYNSKKDGNNEVICTGGGQMKVDGKGILLPTSASYWSSTAGTTSGNYVYMAWTTSISTGTFLVSSAGTQTDKALQVRCVRKK